MTPEMMAHVVSPTAEPVREANGLIHTGTPDGMSGHYKAPTAPHVPNAAPAGLKTSLADQRAYSEASKNIAAREAARPVEYSMRGNPPLTLEGIAAQIAAGKK